MEIMNKIFSPIKNYFKKHPYVLIMFIVMGVWMSINMIQSRNSILLREKKGKYTIAEVKKVSVQKTGKFVSIEYINSGKKITSERRFENIPKNFIGEKIFIKFVPGDYHNWEQIMEVPVPDSLKKLPPAVWDSLPVM